MSEILVAAFFVLLDTMSRSGKERHDIQFSQDKILAMFVTIFIE